MVGLICCLLALAYLLFGIWCWVDSILIWWKSAIERVLVAIVVSYNEFSLSGSTHRQIIVYAQRACVRI